MRNLQVYLTVLIAFAVAGSALAAPATRPDPTAGLTPEQRAAYEKDRQAKSEAALTQFLADIKSNDPVKVTAAMATLHSVVMMKTREFDPWRALDAAQAAGHYQEIEAMCQESALANADQVWVIGRVEKARAQALLGEAKPAEALAAAKQYYNVCQLDQTNDAITLVAVCLLKARPDEKGLNKRFKQQQLAGAGVASSPEAPQADLGAPILPTIVVDPKPFEAAINAAAPADTYKSYIKKGNLLLLADRTVEARKLFEEGYELAEGNDVGPAIENVARAIRAQTGSVGPANAFIVSVRDKAAGK